MNRESWLLWRSQGLGASDSPIIMGVSPWMTAQELWLLKTGQKTMVQKNNWAIDRGNRLEPLARAHYELLKNCDSPPRIAEHPKYSFIRASLDGFNAENNSILEIKCPGKADHEKALRGKIPLKYYPQVQHQIAVMHADYCDYFSFDGHNGVIVRIDPDPPYILWLIDELHRFWHAVTTKTPPEPLINIVVPSGVAE